MIIKEGTINESLKNQIFEWFKGNGIELPTPVSNAVSSIFDENDFYDYNIDENSINIYFKEDVKDFENDLKVINKIKINTTGISEGIATDSFTFYGNILHGLDEIINLTDGDTPLTTILQENKTRTKIKDPSDYVVNLLHQYSFGKNKVEDKFYIYIYCPIEYSLNKDAPDLNKKKDALHE